MATKRILQINRELQKELSYLIYNFSLPFETLIQITDVNTSPDLKSAQVFVSFLETSPHKIKESEILDFLQMKAPEMQHHLALKFRWKFIPKLTFIFDTSIAHAQRIEELLNKIKKDQSRLGRA
jgi:ribosome-binding factor A